MDGCGEALGRHRADLSQAISRYRGDFLNARNVQQDRADGFDRRLARHNDQLSCLERDVPILRERMKSEVARLDGLLSSRTASCVATKANVNDNDARAPRGRKRSLDESSSEGCSTHERRLQSLERDATTLFRRTASCVQQIHSLNDLMDRVSRLETTQSGHDSCATRLQYQELVRRVVGSEYNIRRFNDLEATQRNPFLTPLFAPHGNRTPDHLSSPDRLHWYGARRH